MVEGKGERSAMVILEAEEESCPMFEGEEELSAMVEGEDERPAMGDAEEEGSANDMDSRTSTPLPLAREPSSTKRQAGPARLQCELTFWLHRRAQLRFAVVSMVRPSSWRS